MKTLAGVMGSLIAFSMALGALGGGMSPSPSLLAGAAGAPGVVTAAPAAPMSRRAARAANKTGLASMQNGRHADALRQYESVLASTNPKDDARGEALYWAALLRISPDPALRDIDRARAYLGELKVFHGGSDHQAEVSILLALTESIGDSSRTAETLRAELATSTRNNESCRAERDAADGKLHAALSENERLKESDSAQRAEIQGLREEVTRKDVALRKVKEVVAGWKAPR